MVYVRIPVFQQTQQVVDSDGRFTPPALRALNDAIRTLGDAINAIASIPEIQQALQNLDQAIQAAQQAAQDANDATASVSREAALQGSYIDPDSVLSASTTTITIAAHTRKYADGTSVAVAGGSVPVSAPGDVDYVFYDDPSRAGGAVAYVVALAQPVQSGDRHVVGAVGVPTVGTANGGAGPRPPGYVSPIP